jgi:5'-nucleotidase
MLSGIPSIAISHDSHAYDRDMSVAAKYASKIVKSIDKIGIRQGTLLNINVPDLPYDHIQGIRTVRQGGSVWEDSFEKRVDPFGHDYYWFSGRYSHIDTDPYSDDQALKDGFVTVTPLRYDLTDRDLLGELKDHQW